jgi:hypothetical protein
MKLKIKSNLYYKIIYPIWSIRIRKFWKIYDQVKLLDYEDYLLIKKDVDRLIIENKKYLQKLEKRINSNNN